MRATVCYGLRETESPNHRHDPGDAGRPASQLSFLPRRRSESPESPERQVSMRDRGINAADDPGGAAKGGCASRAPRPRAADSSRHPEALAKRASKGDGPGVAAHPSRRPLRGLLRMTVNISDRTFVSSLVKQPTLRRPG